MRQNNTYINRTKNTTQGERKELEFNNADVHEMDNT